MGHITKGFFPESEAKFFEQHYFNFWPKGIDKRWFWLAFQAMEKGGLTYYESEEEEMDVREMLALLAVFYYEYCHESAACESENFNLWPSTFIEDVKKDFSIRVDDLLFEIWGALVSYFGDENKVADELWFNCTEGSTNCLVPINKISVASWDNDYLKEKAEGWFTGGGFEIKGFMGMSI